MVTEDGKHTAWSGAMGVWGKARNDACFKNEKDTITTDCPIRFQGQWEDVESGLHYNRHRYYDPDAAQYISPDPIGLEGGTNPQGYVNDPSGWVDPLGLAGCGDGVDPSTINFTQSSVGNTINTPNGKRPLRKLVKDLVGGRVSADDLPPIRVFEKNGQLFTLDNRRLKAFQVAGKPINTVKATPKEISNDAFKFTSKNGGTSVKVRGGGL